MYRKIQIVLLLSLFAAIGYGQQSETQLNYIKAYKEIAVREMERTGVPASIKLAQGILESNSGQSVLARRANNHFGMKCGSTWQGDTYYREDDDYNEQGQLIKSCFRGYKNGQASFVAHSEFLRDPRKAFRYGFLFRLDPKDYQRWAYGLKQAGYATSPTYPQKLISLIERYQLYQYDNETSIDVEAPSEIVSAAILDNNDVRYVVVGDGESLADIAQRVNVSVSNLLRYNENLPQTRSEAEDGERVYVQPKRNGYRGDRKFHTVKVGETMFDISQQYAVKLSKLLVRNQMAPGHEPAVGELIKLRGHKVPIAPKLRSEETPPTFIPADPTPSRPSTPINTDDELDMEEPDTIDFEEEDELPPITPQPNRPINDNPTNPSNPTVEPNRPNSGGQGTIIINPGSEPAPGNTNPPPTVNPAPDLPPPVVNPAPSNPPVVNPAPAPVINPTPAPTTTGQLHTVVKGDTLYNISRRYNTTVEALKTLNGLTSNNIFIGQELRVR